MSDIKEKLRRVEKVTAGEEPITQKQAMILMLGLFSDFWGEIEEPIKQVPLNTTGIEVLKVRVGLGIGLTALVGIAGGIALIAGGG